MERFAIIGFGCAGYSAAKALRCAGFSGELHVFEATAEPPANPMLTTYYLSGKLPRLGAYPFGPMEEIRAEFRLTLHPRTCVTHIDAARELTLTDGSVHSFDKILVSTGARAFLPPLQGLPDPRVFVMRTMEDADRMKALLDQGGVRSAVVVGASMAGIKVVELLAARGIRVELADLAPHLFPLAAYETVARRLEEVVRGRGVTFRWNTALESITPTGVRYQDGGTADADLICLCVGTRANVELVANTEVAQGQVRIERGIVVSDRMETSAPGIYAAGDCCQGTNLQTGETGIIGLWANAGCQGETAGRNMAGIPTEYPGNIIHNITHFMDMDFISLGDIHQSGETVAFGSPDGPSYIQAVVGDGGLRSVNILQNYRISGVVKSLLIRQFTQPGTSLSPLQKGLLRKGGLPDAFINLLGGTHHD